MPADIKAYTPFQEAFGTFFIRNVGRLQVKLYELTGGRLFNTFLGAPVAILTTRGRKSGKLRKSPLLYLEQGDRVLVAATKGGMSKAPLWYLNLKANPEVRIQIGSHKRSMLAREADDAEAAGLWPALDAMYSGYEEYRQRLEGIRKAPIIVLEPLDRA